MTVATSSLSNDPRSVAMDVDSVSRAAPSGDSSLLSKGLHEVHGATSSRILMNTSKHEEEPRKNSSASDSQECQSNLPEKDTLTEQLAGTKAPIERRRSFIHSYPLFNPSMSTTTQRSTNAKSIPGSVGISGQAQGHHLAESPPSSNQKLSPLLNQMSELQLRSFGQRIIQYSQVVRTFATHLAHSLQEAAVQHTTVVDLLRSQLGPNLYLTSSDEDIRAGYEEPDLTSVAQGEPFSCQDIQPKVNKIRYPEQANICSRQ